MPSLVGRALRATSEALVEASRVHDAELTEDAVPREARDGATAELISLTVGIRSTIDTVSGSAKAKAMAAQDSMFSGGAGFISATLALVGERDLAEKTRPSTRRAGTTAAIEEASNGAGDNAAEIPK